MGEKATPTSDRCRLCLGWGRVRCYPLTTDRTWVEADCPECSATTDEIERLRAAVALHAPLDWRPGSSAHICAECDAPWPCLTAHTAGVQ